MAKRPLSYWERKRLREVEGREALRRFREKMLGTTEAPEPNPRAARFLKLLRRRLKRQG